MEDSRQGSKSEQINRMWAEIEPQVHAFAYRRTGSKSMADDIVQETFIRLWKKRAELEEIQNPEAWCMTVARNLIFDEARKAKHKSGAELNDVEHLHPVESEVEEKLHRLALIKTVKGVIAALPQKQKEAIELRDIEGLTYKEVAKRMNSSIHAVKVNIFRGRQAIKEEMKKQYKHEL